MFRQVAESGTKNAFKIEEATKMSGLIVPNPAMSSAEKMIPVQI
jgi:hypothetical protein